jgi:hypothetical protein
MTTTQDTTDFDRRPDIEDANRRAVEAGETIEDKQYVDYFAEPETHRYYLPDGKQYFDYQELREGGKALYEKATNKDIRVQRATGDARLAVDPATQRQVMIRLSVVDVLVFQRGERLEFNKDKPGKFWEIVFERFPAKLVQDLYEDIQKVNTWLAADDDLEALKEERERLDERIERAEEEQAKKLSS